MQRPEAEGYYTHHIIQGMWHAKINDIPERKEGIQVGAGIKFDIYMSSYLKIT